MASPELAAVVVYTLLCLGLGLGLLLAARLLTAWLRTARPARGKYEPYECGVPLLGSARVRFGVKFYLVALLFVLFDIETLFLLPYAVAYRELGWAGFLEVAVFVGVLGLGLLYLYRRGALEWE